MDRLVTGVLLGMALFWAGACFWIRGAGVPDWWLPSAFAAGFCLTARTSVVDRTASPCWSRWLAWVVVATVFAALLFGALATPSRHWDGAATFDPKIFWLEDSPTLAQPFFATRGVFNHSPDYPLLLPMLIAMVERLVPELGRVVLPMIYLLLCGVVASALQRRAIAPLLGTAITVAVAVTPAMLTPGGGAVDSGYAECLLLLATTTVAAGLLNRRLLWFVIGIVLLIAAKPEGQAYALVALAVTYARFEGRLLVYGIAALLIACTIWEPVQAALLLSDPEPWLTIPLVVIVGFSSLRFVIKRFAPRFDASERRRWALVLALPVIGLAVLPCIAPLFAEGDGAVAIYMRQAEFVYIGLANLPHYFAKLFELGITSMKFGVTFLLPIACCLVAWRRGIKLADRSVTAFVLIGLATSALPFVLTPEPDLGHHLRSSLSRLLLHWLGPFWLLSACWLQAIVCDAASLSDEQATHES